MDLAAFRREGRILAAMQNGSVSADEAEQKVDKAIAEEKQAVKKTESVSAKHLRTFDESDESGMM